MCGRRKNSSPAGLWGETGGDSRSPSPKSHPSLQKAGEQEEEEEEVEERKPDPLHQLVLHFSRAALTEKR
ncbi:hypothetical protein HPG69_015595 [Diceros bicornis minor]|uniref:Uncharacterized protein n=1 Tax=Diceros bicornis minor TaxID=77932 RepID=A0A7J7FEK9_DICBM|nr:hypothetical protein HPG69_015595 [Diceros bicornis minor]